MLISDRDARILNLRHQCNQRLKFWGKWSPISPISRFLPGARFQVFRSTIIHYLRPRRSPRPPPLPKSEIPFRAPQACNPNDMTPGPNKQKGKGKEKEKERERTRLPKPTPDNMWGFDGGAFYSLPSGWASGAGSSHGSDWNASVPHLPYYRPDFGLSGHFQSPTDDSLGLPEAIKAIGNYEANYAGINAIKEDSADSTPWATASYPPVMVTLILIQRSLRGFPLG